MVRSKLQVTKFAVKILGCKFDCTIFLSACKYVIGIQIYQNLQLVIYYKWIYKLQT